MRTILMVIACVALASAQEREETACEICGGTVLQTPKKFTTGNTRYVWIGEPPHKKYCNRCQRDINNGKIDPSDPPTLLSRDDEEQEAAENPYSREVVVEKPKRKQSAEAESGFGAMGWVIGIVGVLGFFLRKMLK